jgi:hypothetical protein
MDQDQDWSRTKLEHYLLFDNWDEYPAWCVLVGLDYFQGSGGKNAETLDSGFFLAVDDKTYKAIIADMANKVDRLRDYSQSADKAIASYAPSSFIDWALSKRIRPPWLDWAIQKNLYIPKQEASQNKVATTTYSTKWLEIQQAAILEFFSPRQEVDAKQAAVVSWIESEAKKAGIKDPRNVATVMFTIIKPEDHSPKIRRAGPIKTQQP